MYSSLYKGALAFQQKAHEPFGTPNVQAGALSDVRKILREVGLTPDELQLLLEREVPGSRAEFQILSPCSAGFRHLICIHHSAIKRFRKS